MASMKEAELDVYATVVINVLINFKLYVNDAASYISL